MRQLIVIFALIYTTFCFAQTKSTIRGVIKDAYNGETLLGASIVLNNTSYGVITNEYGFYSLTVPNGNYTLTVSYVGYNSKTQNIQLQNDLSLNVELEEVTTSLNEVVIEVNEKEHVDLKKPQMSVSKLSSERIKKIPVVLGEVDILKSIQSLPGVTNNGEASPGFHVRGGAADQNLVLLDEAIIYNTSHFFGFFSIFNADAVKDITLYKGDIPAKYGGRVSSVLDVRQKDGNSKKLSINGGISLISSRLSAEAPIFGDKGSFLLAGRTTYTKIFLQLSDELKNNKIGFYDLNLKTNYEINKNNKLYLSAYFGRDVLNFSKELNNTYGNITGNLRWNHIFNQKLFSNLSLIYSKYDYQFIIDYIGLDWTANIINNNIKYDFKYYLNDKIKMDFGASAINYSLNPGAIRPTSEKASFNETVLDKKKAVELGFYASLEYNITDKLSIQPGLRYSSFSSLGGRSLTNYENDKPVVYNNELQIYEHGTPIGKTAYEKGERITTYGNFEPRLGLAYQINDKSTVKASYTQLAQYIHLLSNTATITPIDVYTLSDKFVKPQKATQYAVGYFKNFDNKYDLEVETYYKSILNRIDYIDGSSLIGNNNIETEILNGTSRAYGLEVLIRKNTGNLTGWLSYTLSKSEQQTLGGDAGGPGINDGKWYNTPYDRTHNLNLTGIYKASEKWQFSGNFVFQTGRPATYPNGQYQYEGSSFATYSNRNENRLPAYHRLDISATLTPRKNADRKWKGEWVFGIYNVYNRKNAASVSFAQNTETGENEAKRFSVFGLIPSATYNFKF